MCIVKLVKIEVYLIVPLNSSILYLSMYKISVFLCQFILKQLCFLITVLCVAQMRRSVKQYVDL